MGAPDPRDEAPDAISTTDSHAAQSVIDFAKARQSWAFQPPTTQVLPPVRDSAWPRRRIDYFVLAKLDQAQLRPNEKATRRTWIRRCSFDLTGLPPSPEDVASYLADDSRTADERLVDRLLASPQFGERWARVWLDIGRYAEDQAHIVGDDKELFYPNAYRYREWVIRSLANDMPYDRFVRLQLAADLVVPDEPAEHVALGFLGLGPKYYNRGRLEVMAEEWEDRVDVVTRGLLGLTVACARCHDHKFDPITQSDYYGLAGIFASTEMFNRPISPEAEKLDNGQAKRPDDAIHIVREKEPTDLHIFLRGDVNKKGALVRRRFLEVLCPSAPVEFAGSSGRKELAEAIVSPSNPLTARVFVNRVFAELVGQAIVGSRSNFGAQGRPPTHPELLDDLSAQFIQNGWSLKWLVREIALSATYRQASCAEPEQIAADPANVWLGRMNRRRLGIEAWRDAALAAADRLDQRLGGTSVHIEEPECNRRTVYAYVSRLELDPMLARFDFPDANVHSEGRAQTTTPLQKLFVMNNPIMIENSRGLARRVLDWADSDDERIQYAYQLLFGRPPSQNELELALEYLQSAPSDDAWQNYAHALMASNEMTFLD
jgi:hypothetical protein